MTWNETLRDLRLTHTMKKQCSDNYTTKQVSFRLNDIIVSLTPHLAQISGEVLASLRFQHEMRIGILKEKQEICIKPLDFLVVSDTV